MSSNQRPTRNQEHRFQTVVEMNAHGLPASTIINNSIMAGQASRRNKLRTCGDDQMKRKNAQRERLRKKLAAKKAFQEKSAATYKKYKCPK